MKVEDIDDDNFIEDIENYSETIEEDIEGDDEIKVSKHKEDGKHALKYDSIFKGKKHDGDVDEYIIECNSKTNNYEPDASSNYSFERESPIEYARIKKLREELYNIVVNILALDTTSPRRKPSKVNFIKYYTTIVSILDMEVYTYSEVFVEFSQYFSENTTNMFKLLDGTWGGKISKELAQKYNIKGVKNLDNVDFV